MNDSVEHPPPDEQPPAELLAELMVALSARWQTDEGKLALGAPRARLVAAAGVGEPELDRLLAALGAQVARLGLEFVDYYYEREHWYCLKSQYAAPNELSPVEQGVLGAVIGMLEAADRPERARVALADLRTRLVGGKYLSRYQLDQATASLDSLGFLVRKRTHLSYGPRALIELSTERRANIAEEAETLIF